MMRHPVDTSGCGASVGGGLVPLGTPETPPIPYHPLLPARQERRILLPPPMAPVSTGIGANPKVPTLRIDARPESLASIRRFIRAVSSSEGLDRQRTEDLVQAVDETATNVIVHGYQLQRGELEIEARRDGEDLVVFLRDRAPRFDPTTVPAPDLHVPFARRRAGGMGVFLARELCDEMRYRPIPGGGNELELVQRAGNGAAEARTRALGGA
jgi:serine/threonine-protein kinase RsbW